MGKLQRYEVPIVPEKEGEVDIDFITKNGKQIKSFKGDIDYTKQAECYGYAIEAKNGSEYGVLLYIPNVRLSIGGK